MSENNPMMIGKLKINCRYYTNKNSKKPLTDMSILVGDKVVATRTSAGNWDEDYVLTELKRFPERFKLNEGWTLEQLKALTKLI